MELHIIMGRDDSNKFETKYYKQTDRQKKKPEHNIDIGHIELTMIAVDWV